MLHRVLASFAANITNLINGNAARKILFTRHQPRIYMEINFKKRRKLAFMLKKEYSF